MLYFDLLSSDIVKEGADSKYDMSFSKLNSHLDSKFLKIYTPHVSVVLLLHMLMYSCCYGYCYYPYQSKSMGMVWDCLDHI